MAEQVAMALDLRHVWSCEFERHFVIYISIQSGIVFARLLLCRYESCAIRLDAAEFELQFSGNAKGDTGISGVSNLYSGLAFLAYTAVIPTTSCPTERWKRPSRKLENTRAKVAFQPMACPTLPGSDQSHRRLRPRIKAFPAVLMPSRRMIPEFPR
jgi:hypothetical protein